MCVYILNCIRYVWFVLYCIALFYFPDTFSVMFFLFQWFIFGHIMSKRISVFLLDCIRYVWFVLYCIALFYFLDIFSVMFFFSVIHNFIMSVYLYNVCISTELHRICVICFILHCSYPFSMIHNSSSLPYIWIFVCI